jgi:hypothetical protein
MNKIDIKYSGNSGDNSGQFHLIQDDVEFHRWFGGPPPSPSPRDSTEEPVGIDRRIEKAEWKRSKVRTDAGKPPGALSLSILETIDLLSEGPIEGITSGEYAYTSIVGETGYESAKFSPFIPISAGSSEAHVSGYLRSVYYNDVEIMTRQAYLNYRDTDFAFTLGEPRGEAIGLADAVTDNPLDKLQVIKTIGERLFGPEIQYKKTSTDQDSYNPDNMELKAGEDSQGRDQAKFYKILNKHCTSFKVVIRVSSLFRRELGGPFNYQGDRPAIGKGDIKGDYITYRIDYRPYFGDDEKNVDFWERDSNGNLTSQSTSNVSLESIYGVVRAGYLRETSVEIDESKFRPDMEHPSFLGWKVAVYRETWDSFGTHAANQTSVDSIIEIYNEKYCYPNSAYVRSRFRADSFSAIPKRTFMTKGIKVKVPNNYNPILKTYGSIRNSPPEGHDPTVDEAYDENGNRIGDGSTTEDWNGDWKRRSDGTILKQWTDNPVWIFYDLITNIRYGLGKYMEENNIDKWTLYEISKYCDEMVPNGLTNRDGTAQGEPRFACNVAVTTRDDAYGIINSFASIFRGLSYYQGGKLQATFDSPKETQYTFSNANVIDGKFVYSNSGRKARHTVCIVKYNDKFEHYKPQLEYVEEVGGIKKYGTRVKDLTAFGCVTRSQARRLAKYVLLTESLETQNIAFSAGIEGAYISPGDVIGVSDIHRTSYDTFLKNRQGGRSPRIDVATGETDAPSWVYLDQSISGFIRDTAIIEGKEFFTLKVLTPPSYVDSINTRIDGSVAAQNYLHRPAIQEFQFNKSDVIHTGAEGVLHSYQQSGGDEGDYVSVINLTGNYSEGINVFDGETYNVTGFSGLLYDNNGNVLLDNGVESGFIEPKPDSFIWTIEVTGETREIDDLERFRVITVQEKEQFRYNINAIEYAPEKYPLIDDLYEEVSPSMALFPTKPNGIRATATAISNTHAYKIDITVEKSSVADQEALLGKLMGYKFYIKRAELGDDGSNDFNASTDFTDDPYGFLPNNEFFLGFVSHPNTATLYVPMTNGRFYIRAYAVNRAGQCSPSLTEFVYTTIDITGVFLILDLVISSLALEGEILAEGATNRHGQKDSNGEYITANIDVGWDASFSAALLDALEQDGYGGISIPNDFTYRVSYRETTGPTAANPSTNLLFERVDVAATRFSDTLSIAENAAIPDDPDMGTTIGDGISPYRTMDVVVEGVDPNGYSSAGGQIIRNEAGDVTSDSTYTNNPGYDILYVNNEPFPSVNLTDRYGTPEGAVVETCENTTDPNFCTDMWLEEDGSVNLVVEKDDADPPILGDQPDLRCAVFIVSKGSFVASDIPDMLTAFEGDSLTDSISTRIKLPEASFPSSYIFFSEGLSEDANLAFSIKTPFVDIGKEAFVDDIAMEGVTPHLFVSVGFIDQFWISTLDVAPAKKTLLRKVVWSERVVRVMSRNSFLEGSLKWRAWIYYNINANARRELHYHSANISKTEFVNHGANYNIRQAKRMGGKGDGTAYKVFTIDATRSGRRFWFSSPLPSSLYEVFVTFSPDPMRSNYYSLTKPVPTFGGTSGVRFSLGERTKEYFEIGDISLGGYGGAPLHGCFFAGVLLGTKMNKLKGIPLPSQVGPNADSTWLSQSYAYVYDRSTSMTPTSITTDIGTYSLDFNAGSQSKCVIASHAVETGAFTESQRQEAIRWCIKYFHNTWYGEAFRRGYRESAKAFIASGEHEDAYKIFQNYIDFATGKNRNLKTACTFIWRTVSLVLRGLTIKK